MVTINEARTTISQRRQEISNAKQNIENVKKAIPETTQMQLRGNRGSPSGLMGRALQRKLKGAREEVSNAEVQIKGYEQDIANYEGQVDEYLTTESGRLQYAREENITPEPIYDRVVKGGSIELVGYKYNTPYGEVTDWSPKQELLRDQAILEGIEFEENAAVAQAVGLTSSAQLQKAGIDVKRFLKGDEITISSDIGEVRAGQKLNFDKNTSMFTITDSEFKKEVVQEMPTVENFVRDEGIQGRQNYRGFATGFSIVSASSDSNNKDLNSSNIKKVNELNVSSGKGNGFISNTFTRVRNIIGSGSDFKKGYEEEIYNPQLGAYVSASPIGSSATGMIRIANPQEKLQIEQAQYKGSIKGIVNQVSGLSEKFNVWYGGEDYKDKSQIYLDKLPKPRQQNWLNPEIVKKGFDLLAEGTLIVGEKVGKDVKRYYDIRGVDKNTKAYQLLFNPEKNPIKRKTAKELISTAYMFSAFEPIMRTGTYQQSQYADEVVEVIYNGQKVKMTKSEAISRGLIPADMRSALISDLQYYPKEEQIKLIKKMFESRKYVDDISFQQDVIKVTSFMKQAGLKNDRIKEILKSTFPERFVKKNTKSTIIEAASEGGITMSAGASVSAGVSENILKSSDDLFFKGSSGVELKGISIPETISSSTIKPELVRETAWIKNSMMDTKQNMFISQDIKQNSKTITILKLDTKTKQDTRQMVRQDFDNLTIQKTKQTSKLNLKTNTVQDFFSPQIEKTKTSTKTKTNSKLEEPIKPKKPIIPKGSNLLNRLSKKADEGEFEAFILKGGKEVSIAKGSKIKVTKQLKDKLIGTLSASGFIKEKSTDRKLRAEETGLLGLEFRKAKKNEFLVVERKEKRLRRGTTGKDVQYFRGVTNKTNKKSKSNWLSGI